MYWIFFLRFFFVCVVICGLLLFVMEENKVSGNVNRLEKMDTRFDKFKVVMIKKFIS